MRGRARMIVCLILAAAATVLGGGECRGQKALIKTNLLYWATTTPNIGAEFYLSRHFSISASVGYNGWNFPSYSRPDGEKVNPKFHHWAVMPEIKYWPCRTFTRSFWGLHAVAGSFNVGGWKFPEFLHYSRYQGDAYGAGISYGYQWSFGNRWSIEASLGVGYARLIFDKYECINCGDKEKSEKKNYIGPTKAAISLILFLD